MTAALLLGLLALQAPDDSLLAAYERALTVSHQPNAFREREALDSALARAFRQSPDEPRVFIALGYLRYAQGRRVDAGRMLARAEERFDRARRALTPRDRALATWLRGRIAQDSWRDYRSFGQLGPNVMGQWFCEEFGLELDMDPTVASSIVTFNLGCPAKFEWLMDQGFQSNVDSRRAARNEMEDRYRAVLRDLPDHAPARLALAGELVYEAQWEVMHELVRRATSPRETAARALAEYRMGRDTVAWRLFDSALAGMSAEDRAAYTSPERVLSTIEARTFSTLSPAMREEVGRAYWRSREVLFLSGENERLLEHYARITEADLIFGDPLLGIRGWNTSPGEIWIRYGRPLKIRDLIDEGGRLSFWSWGPDPDIVFSRNLTYSQYRVHQEAEGAVVQLRERAPVRFRPPGLDTVVTLRGQVVRFRTAQDTTTDLLVVAPYPPEGPDGLTLGFTLLDDRFRRRAQWSGAPTAPRGIEIAVPGLASGTFNLVVEALVGARSALYQLRDTITIRSTSGFGVSDLLLARDVRGPVTARSRRMLTIDHLHAAQVGSGDPVTVYWEVYEPPVDTAGRTVYQVTIEVRDAARRPLLARAIRTIGGAFSSDQPGARITYERTAEPFDQRVIDWVTVSGDWGPGTYEVTVLIQHPTAGTASARRAFVVVAP